MADFMMVIMDCAIDLPPRGAPWETYTHTAKGTHLTFFSTFVPASYICESLFRSPSRLCDFDVSPLL
nr:hypothetical transcript [Hymenolepis microstoma]